jgi:hypothetical protein
MNKIKYILLTPAIWLFSGCTSSEYPNYIGQVPYYAVNKAPHPVNCGCCVNRKIGTQR